MEQEHIASHSHHLRGKVALVTGGSSGIGTSIVETLLGLGLRVVTCARRLDRLTALHERHNRTDNLLPVAADLRSEQDITALFSQIRERWGSVDILVNNAGLGRKSSLLDGESSAWREMLEVNVLALCICTREAIADMRTHGTAGHVIHISSMAGHRVPPGSGVYSASKYAVRALTEGLRQELREAGSPIRVTAISPGFVETEFAENYHQSKTKAEEIYGQYQVLTANDIARAVVYALEQPAHVQVHDILVRPTSQRT